MSADRAADADFQRQVVDRDGQCIYCGESRREYLCGHHLITRGNPASRHDLRNGVAVCNGATVRWVDGLGMCKVGCHTLAEDNKNWALERAMRHFIRLGYFKNATEYARWNGGAREGRT